MTKILVTGVAGFIGSFVADALLKRGDKVIGIDNINEYYDPSLKEARLKHFFNGNNNFTFYKIDFSDYEEMEKIFEKHKIDKICHLGAQAGVRYSLENPFVYLKSNINGTVVIFELARKFGIKTIIYASSSSVYGGNKKIPFSTEDRVDKPISIYAATKKADELIAHAYHHLYGIKMTGLRFFTVYGPWGRPDMALFKFTKNIIENKPIDVYNKGDMERDFTFVADIVSGVLSALDKEWDFEIFNLGNNKPVKLMEFIEVLESVLGKKAEKNLLPMQPGDVPTTFADISSAEKQLDYSPKTDLKEGIKAFVDWYKGYYDVR